MSTMRLGAEVFERPKKRKRSDEAGTSSKRHSIGAEDTPRDKEAEILLLENNILESRKHYNDIVVLLSHLQIGDAEVTRITAIAAVSLCRIFCRLMAGGHLKTAGQIAADEFKVRTWLEGQLETFRTTILDMISAGNGHDTGLLLTLLMRLIKEQSKHMTGIPRDLWTIGAFHSLMVTMIDSSDSTTVCREFAQTYLSSFDDLRYYTCLNISDILSQQSSSRRIDSAIILMSLVEHNNEQPEEFPRCFSQLPTNAKKSIDVHSPTAHRKQAQAAWLAIIRQDLTKAQRKRILELMSSHITPTFVQAELLMDFLTDCFNVGGSTSLSAISGLFYLIQHKNLDFPQFYDKLYAMLDANVLHSKHRSRFFRLLEKFLDSTHLPAALVASFMKRISRLSLFAPPSAIVVIVPWIYNMLKAHPTCTFMIHRSSKLALLDRLYWGDPFNMQESDPMDTHALESSLWEIEMLQSHYHPNVATIAKIISEQFTKPAYNIEDFLDHSYSTMLHTELSKDIRKPPEIEYEIPKKIFTKYEADACKEDSLLVRLWDFA